MKLTRLLFTHRNYVSKYLIKGGLEKEPAFISLCRSHRMMFYSQLIAPSATGAFNFLPLGMRSLDKLSSLISNEMSAIGCQKINMSCLSGALPWKISKRWDTMGDELMKLRVSNSDHCLNPTHEEAVTNMVGSMGIVPLNALPLKLYQLTTKFRDEPRPHFGLLRSREFLMKDLYSFDKDVADATDTYNEVCETYGRIFHKLGLPYIKAKSSCGHMGGQMSHEYLVPSGIGEDKVFFDEDGNAWNSEYEEEISSKHLTLTQAIEVGHTFLLGTIYSKIFGAEFLKSNSKPASLQMGCYGLGVSRILATCVEIFSTDKEIRWPYPIAPFKVCIIPPKEGSKEEKQLANLGIDLYSILNQDPFLNGDVIIDDRTNKTIGKRIKDAGVIGYPIQVIPGKTLFDEEPMIEVNFLNKRQEKNFPLSALVGAISNEFQ